MTSKINQNLPRSLQKIEFNNNQDIEFSIIDWFECDMNNENKQYGYWLNKEHDKSYKLFAFGVTSEGHSVCLRINNYHPYFFLQIPENFNEKQISDFKEAILSEDYEDVDKEDFQDEDDENVKNEIKFQSTYYKTSICHDDCITSKNQIFWSFMNGKLFKFFKLSTYSKNSYKFLQRYFQKAVDLNITGYNGRPIKYKQFESDLDIQLRFFHDSKIKPSHWIKIPAELYQKVDYQSRCQINIECDWKNIVPVEKTEIPPLIVASFDIEADSSHGDFPQPLKDCKKLANNLVVAWIRDNRIIQKEDNKSAKYLSAKEELELKGDFFRRRIEQSLGVDKYQAYDIDVSKIYLKRDIRALRNLESEGFSDLCNELFDICNHPIRKVKTDTAMKKAVVLVNNMQDEEIKNKGYITLEKFKTFIKEVSQKTKIPLVELQAKIITKEVMARFVNRELNNFFKRAHGDPVIQIGTVFWKFGDDKPFHNNIITLKGCSSFDVGDSPCEIISRNNEINVLIEWKKLIEKYDPDIITGYNIFGFDETFMYDRLIDLVGNFENKNISKDQIRDLERDDVYQKCMNLTRFHPDFIKNVSEAKGKLINKKLSSSALGDNFLYYFNMPGVVQIDLLKVCQSSMDKLPSYKLDSVAEFYISGKLKKFLPDEKYPDGSQTRIIEVDNIKELDNGNFVVVNMMTTGQKLYDGDKMKILELNRENNIIKLDRPVPTNCMATIPMWGLAKDDVSPKDIFRLQKGNNDDRSIIAKYCIQDCALLIRLIKKLDTIPNNFGMSNVCLVPFSYIFMRGQGIKIFSLMVNECSLNNFKLPVLEKIYPEEEELDTTDRLKNPKINPNSGEMRQSNLDDDDPNDDDNDFQLKSDFNVIKMTEDSYEGAIVLTPKPDIYTEPITVLDFSSLYPSEMIASDLSHDRICEDPYWLGDEGVKRIKALGLDYLDRTYDNYTWVDPTNKNKGKKKDGEKTVRFIQYPDGTKGLIPKIEQKLLGARKATKKLMKSEKDAFKYSILDGLQLAYKLVANSLYGQIGARTSKIFKKEIAASITAGGRMRIYQARDFCLKNNKGCEVVYGDTDSVFVKFNLERPDGSYPETDLDKVKESMDIGLKIQQQLKDENIFPPPHDLEYEKVFYPLILITKKRYIGIKYEFDPEKGKKTSMGVVTKRRDNAPILKHTFIGVVDTLMQERDIPKTINFIREVCYQMIDNKFDLNMFVISKTLKEYYKDPESVAHRVLADRMGERDPGNKPASNERLPYVYIKIDELPGVKYLQGDKIEHINYVRENQCQVDYVTYITNQLLKPVSQILELVVERLPGYPYHDYYFEDLENQYYNKYKGDLKKTYKKVSELKQKLIKKLVFDVVINYAINKVNKVNTLDNWIDDKLIDKESKITEVKEQEKDKSKPKSKADIKKNAKLNSRVKKMKQLDLGSWLQ
jgi:DNA polymerase elongation subunit (family B)